MEDYGLLRYPGSRVVTFDVGRIGGRKHHEAVDGAPAARFVARLVGNREKAKGLE